MGQFLSLVRQLTDLCEGEAGRYVHVTDTGLMVQVKAAHGIILRVLRTLAAPTASTPRRSPSGSRSRFGWTRSGGTARMEQADPRVLGVPSLGWTPAEAARPKVPVLSESPQFVF